LFEKILVANRGEIAVRVIRACKELGIGTVAVHSEADKNSLHSKLADEAFCIGPAQPEHSYLNVPQIISVAEVAGVDAIHPGYGFLAENPQFVEICESCNITFIGPPASVISQLGDKAAARQLVMNAGLPVLPGTENAVKNEQDALSVAKKVSYPVIVKASLGGGGRGMRVVRNSKELRQSLKTASNEARVSFGDTNVYLEKYVENARHVEFQILADKYKNVVHLGERDCSIQRRHQKLIEETPCSALSKRKRKEMGDVAVAIARAVDYENAGTVEFLLDQKGNYYFLEINTRIQVEHPVTEMVTGIDLIKEQIRLAAGESLDLKQGSVDMNGHAIEFRINAEDPKRNFLPQGGLVELFNPPGGPGVRVDSHIYSGYEVPSYYDSLLAKLIVWGRTREEAIMRSKRALGEFIIVGLATTIPFHLDILDNADFKRGHVFTEFVSQGILNNGAGGNGEQART